MLYRADWLARLMTLLMLGMASLAAWPNLTSGDFAWPQASVGADSPPNPLSYQENSAPRGGECVGYACFGQAANQEAGNLISQEEKDNPNDPNWAENGSYSLILHGLIGAAQGAISGGGSTDGIISGGTGAVAGTYVTVELGNVLINKLKTYGISPTSAEGRMLLTLASSAVGAGTGALAGGSATGAVSGASTAAYSTTYNYLNDVNVEQVNKILSQASCSNKGGASACVQQALDYINEVNGQNNAALSACTTAACIEQNLSAMNGGTDAIVGLNDSVSLSVLQALESDQTSSLALASSALEAYPSSLGQDIVTNNTALLSGYGQTLQGYQNEQYQTLLNIAMLGVVPEAGGTEAAVTALEALTDEGTINVTAGEAAADGVAAGSGGIDDAIASVTPNPGETSVYVSTGSNGTTQYVGITDDIPARSAAHLSQKGIEIEAIPGLTNISRDDARAVEQVLIEFNVLGKNGGSLLNKINSIAQSNPKYAAALIRGAAILKSIGYPGF